MAPTEDIDDLSLGEQIDILMEELPLPVQNFLRSPERNAVSLELTRKYQLHADTAGVFERAYLYMLLGIYTPDEFVQELRNGGVSEETIKGLTNDVNELVFKRLRKEEQQPPPPASFRTPPPRPSVPLPRVGEEEVPPNLPGQNIAPAPPPPAPPPQAPSVPIYRNEPTLQVPAPHVRTMAEDMQQASHGMQGRPVTPARSFQTASVPITSAPPPVPPPPPSYVPPAPAPVRLTPVDRAHAGAPITKEYGSDPYREPIE